MGTSDDAQAIQARVEQELTGTHFENFHGITSANVREYVVVPELVRVDPDDLETDVREMWLVLHTDERSVVFDALTKKWAVVDCTSAQRFVAVIWGDTLAQALSNM